MKKQHWILIVIGLLLIGGVFYWYQYRPSEIRKRCSADLKTGTAYDKIYNDCLRKNGLTK